ncbi:putative regulatory protein RecX [Lupinus albus]|uniref:Regulatory protein RecX n=1 Tax=Lupinus albus TaxID=3870 RepID=A0A6A4QP30_LUPAL|nr:putative regulatory protein RecX [Lupinus albus]
MNMATLAGNIICFKLSSRIFSTPLRSIWKSQIVCLKKSRDFSYSVTNTYSNNLKNKTPSLPVEININGRKDVHRRFETSQPVNEFQNDLMSDDIDEDIEQMEEAAETVEEVPIDQTGDSSEKDLVHIDRFTNNVEESAIKLLAARALTAVELRKKLLGKRFSPNAVEAVIKKFLNRGLINDRLYAESYSQSRWSSSTWGPRRIKQALFKKGVSKGDADNAVDVVFKDNDECAEEHNSVIGLSKHSIDHLYAQATKQWFRGQNVPKETRKARIVRWLQYRGFDWKVTSFILKKLERQEHEREREHDPP